MADETTDVEQKDKPEEEENVILLNGRKCKFRKVEGIGTLNYETGRGELKVRAGDYIITNGGDVDIVVSGEQFDVLKKNEGKPKSETTVTPAPTPVVESEPVSRSRR